MTSSNTDDDATEQSVEEVLDTIGDPHARVILAAISQEPRSAQTLAEDLGYAPATVYQRLSDLEEYDLVTSEMRIAEDGNHYQLFECQFESTLISLQGDEYDVRIVRKESLPGQFSQLWNDLNRTEE